MNIKTPYFVVLGDAPDNLAAKTAFGFAQWRPKLCVEQIKLPNCKTTVELKCLSVGCRTLGGSPMDRRELQASPDTETVHLHSFAAAGAGPLIQFGIAGDLNYKGEIRQ